MGEANVILKEKNRASNVENKLTVTKGWGRRDKLGDLVDIYALLYIKQVTNKNLLYSPGNSTQCSIMAYMGKES